MAQQPISAPMVEGGMSKPLMSRSSRLRSTSGTKVNFKTRYEIHSDVAYGSSNSGNIAAPQANCRVGPAQAKLEHRRRHLVVDCLNTKLPKSLNVVLHGLERFGGVPLPIRDVARDP
jgi:hypothetical protein